MQAVILAAGMGRRLDEYTEKNTKCMLKIFDKTLIERMLDILSEYEISKFILVVGYYGEKVEKLIGYNYNSIPVEYVYNNDYATTNNIYSLYLAKDYLSKEDTLLLESDLIFEKKVIEKLINNKEDNVVLVSKYKHYMDGTVLEIGKNNTIKNFISKEDFIYLDKDKYYKTVNIYKFSKEFSKNSYIPFLEAYISSLGVNEYYEQVLSVVNFLQKKQLKACVLEDTDLWYEIDDKQDYDIAQLLFAEDNQLELFQKRYGGYWRFTNVIDFCYLVNPYFPNKNMMEEIKSFFETLISEYPSGLNVQNLLASKMFHIKEEYIVVGNGAAEIINVLFSYLDEKIGIIAPTFNEYPERINPENIEYLEINNKDFSYSIEELKEFSCSIDSLVLINPDNPSGNFINVNDLLELVDYYNNKNKTIYVDESFVDFSEYFEEASLLKNEILEKYKNLVVIKSISKSYGVPGIRLGIIATANKRVLDIVKGNISIWNINSFGEFFLQIFGKYEKTYKHACKEIINERKRFYEELKKISFIRPIKSQANYILCEVTRKYSSTEITSQLLKEYSIFIKDLHEKKSFEGKNYIRIAVRDKTDNNALIKALKEKSNEDNKP